MQGKPLIILMADDDEDDRLNTAEAFREHRLANDFHTVNDGEELMLYLRRVGKYADAPRPGLILLDLNMPRKDGREALREIKNDPALRSIPVVILTTSSSDLDIEHSYLLHANCYISKPVDLEGFVKVIRSIDNFWLSVVKLPTGEKP